MSEYAARYELDGNIYYRASAIGMCDRLFLALANHYEPKDHPDYFQEILDEGTRSEPFIIARYENQFDFDVTDAQREVKLEVLDGVYIIGHIDGIAVNHRASISDVLFEAKKFRDSTWKKFLTQGIEVYPHYAWQFSAYWHALNIQEGHFVGGHYVPQLDRSGNPIPGKGKITEIEQKVLLAPPIPLLAIKKRIARLEALINDSTNVMDVKCIQPLMYPCPFFYLHDDQDKTGQTTRKGDGIIDTLLSELDQVSKELAPIRREAKKLEERTKALKEGIQGWLVANNVTDDQEALIETEAGTWETKWINVHVDPYQVGEKNYTKVTTKPLSSIEVAASSASRREKSPSPKPPR